MDLHYLILLYYLALLLSVIGGLFRFYALDAPGKIILLLLVATLVSEAVAFYFSARYRNNMPVYHVFAPIQLDLTLGYFLGVLNGWFYRQLLKGTMLLFPLFAMCVSWAVGIYDMPSTTLAVAGFLVIFFSLATLYQIALDTSIANPFLIPHFWVSVVLLFLWMFTFFFWGLYEYLPTRDIPTYTFLRVLLNIIIYGGFFLIFKYCYRTSNEL